MRLLLDTHIALWAVTGSPSLTTEALKQIAQSECFVSVAAVWEIAIKNALSARAGNRLPFSVAHAVDEFRSAGFELLSIDTAHLEEVEQLPQHHRDPFDRLMIAQAIHERMRFATRDRKLPNYGDVILSL